MDSKEHGAVAPGSKRKIAKCRTRSLPSKSTWMQIISYKHTPMYLDGMNEGEDVGEDEVIGLKIRLRFNGDNRGRFEEVIARQSSANDRSGVDFSNLTLRTKQSVQEPQVPYSLQNADSGQSSTSITPFERQWKDETYAFSMREARARLRRPRDRPKDLGINYRWYDQAVQVDAIFPPGVPITAKEIMAFYPHHIRWKEVMLRLSRNNFRGTEMLAMQAHFRGDADKQITTPINTIQRNTIRDVMEDFQSAGYQGKGELNLRTEDFRAGSHIESLRKGYYVPTFEELVRGLKYMPQGIDARGLTQCLVWYMSVRDSFTPKLNLNVLHVQSLIRALKEPLRPVGPQNLDRSALEEWRNDDFKTQEVDHQSTNGKKAEPLETKSGRSKLHIDLAKEEVRMEITLPLRRVFMFPFLNLQGVVQEAFKLGIHNAESRRDARRKGNAFGEARSSQSKQLNDGTEKDTPRATSTLGADTPGSQNDDQDDNKKTQPYRIPKRTQPVRKSDGSIEEAAAGPSSISFDTPPPAGPRSWLYAREPQAWVNRVRQHHQSSTNLQMRSTTPSSLGGREHTYDSGGPQADSEGSSSRPRSSRQFSFRYGEDAVYGRR